MQEQAEIDEGRARRLRVLHASDLHIPSENRTDHEIVSRAFLADVAEQTQKPVEIVVFSGDLANTGQASEFAYASELVLEPLLNGLKLSRDRIILVPGNHDVDRSVINEYTESGLSTALTNRDVVNDLIDTPSKLAAAIDRLESWRQFADQFYSGIERSQARGLGWFAERQVNGVRVGVGALNSAWRSSGSGDLEKGRIIVGDHQLQTMLQLLTECDFPLIAVHHPLEWLAPFDADDVRRELERLGAVVLSGHTHQADPHMLFTSRGAAVYGRGGCLYSSREYFNNYSLIDVDLDARTIDIWVRTWWPRLGKFGVGSDIAEDGHLHFKLQHSEPAALAPIAYSDVSRSLVEIVQRTSVVADLIGERPARTVNELLVPPRFFPLPFGQVAAVSEEKRVKRADPLSDLMPGNVLIINGEPESGVTDALLWLIDGWFATNSDYLPLYITFSARKGGGTIMQDIREAAARAGFNRHQVASRKLILAVDDVTDDERGTARLAEFIGEHRDWIFVLGSHGTAGASISSGLSTLSIPTKTVFLAPFGRRELKLLVRRLAPGSDVHAADQILGVLVEKKLPRNPFLSAAIFHVVRHNADTSRLTATTILEQYASFLLGKASLSTADLSDARNREHLLAHIAAELERRGLMRLQWVDIERLVVEYLDRRGLRSQSAGHILDGLIARRLLVADGDGVGFRHPTIQALFAAKWMSEEARFREEVTSDPLQHAEIVMHAAALSRSDKALLDTVGASTSDVVSVVDAVLSGSHFKEMLDHGGDSIANEVQALARDLRRSAPIPPERIDQRLDEFWDEQSDEPDELVDKWTDQLDLFDAVRLLSVVLTSSELVDDKALKVDLLKLAIHGWSVFCVQSGTDPDNVARLREVLSEVLDRKFERPEFDRLIKVWSLLGTSIIALGLLGRTQMAAILEEVSQDGEFMSTGVHALLVTLVAIRLHISKWPDHLIALYQQHGRHGFVSDMVYNMALWRHQSPLTSDEEAKTLEDFLAPLIADRTTVRGPSDRLVRQRLQHEILSKLRNARTRAKLHGTRGDVLDEGMDDDESSENDESG